MRKLADNLWVFDGKAVKFLGLPFTTRMTVIRLDNGDLWIHSPIKLSNLIQQQLEQLGVIRYLIAPNHLHHLFLGEWQQEYPDALCYGTAEVIKKRNDLTFTASLNGELVAPWDSEVGHVLFTGSPLMEECVFFHKASSTLVLTDLIENFSGKDFNYWQRTIARGVGILAPNGKMPMDWRLSFMFSKPQARKHLEVLFAWRPKTIIMSHGLIVQQNAVSFLTRSFKWLM